MSEANLVPHPLDPRLDEGKLRVTLIKAVVKATQRAKELMFEK